MIPFLFTSARMLGYWDGRHQHELMPGNFYGLTWNEDRAWVSWERDHVHGSLIMALDGELLDLPAMDNVHDILWAQGRLWITDTAHDRVVAVDGAQVERFPLAPGGHDSLHLNSLWAPPRALPRVCEGVRDGEWDERVCVLASGLAGTDAGHPATVLDLDGTALCEMRGLFCHNFYVEDGVLYGCYKRDRESGVYRMALREPLYPALFPMGPNAFARGLARGDDLFLFGQSVSVERERRMDGHSTVVVADDDLEIVDQIQLRDTGQLRAVRLPDGDRAHNGLPFPKSGIFPGEIT